MNETLDEPACTNIPTAWCPLITQPDTIKNLFRILEADIRNEKSTAIKIKASQSLAHLANVRHSIFDSADARVAYVTMFVQALIVFMTSAGLQRYVLSDRQLYKEFVPIPLKIQSNFQVRDLQKAGDALLEGYLTELFKFTIASYKTPSVSVKYHASKLNHLWQRVLFEAMALNIPCQQRLDELINEIVQTYLDENLQQKAMTISSFPSEDDPDDDDENFEKN